LRLLRAHRTQHVRQALQQIFKLWRVAIALGTESPLEQRVGQFRRVRRAFADARAPDRVAP